MNGYIYREKPEVEPFSFCFLAFGIFSSLSGHKPNVLFDRNRNQYWTSMRLTYQMDAVC